MYQVYQKPLRGNSVGIVFGTFAPLHQGHLDVIMRAKKENDGGVLVICCGNNTDDKGCAVGLPLSKRYRYMREFFKDDDLVSIHAIEDIGAITYSFENWKPWLKQFDDICKTAIDWQVTNKTWYVGEQVYYDDLTKLGKNVILLDREDNPISATMIRNNPIKYWNKIALPFRREFSHNILVIGTASEGKTNLVQDLAKYFGTSHAHEWARDYIEEHCLADWEFTTNNFLSFLIGQMQHIEDQISSPLNNGVFFCDTDAMITGMYARKYATDSDCDMTVNDYFKVIRRVVDHIVCSTRWDKIFFLEPGNDFVDDHTRFMKHSEMKDRNSMAGWLGSALNTYFLADITTNLPGGDYLGNFETIKNYAKEIYNNAYVD